jgi:alpha-aminoadipate/glutamate carrier protein LysW
MIGIRVRGGTKRMAVCPECEADIEIDEFDVDKGEIISCPECGVDLEVVGLSPLELELSAEDEEGWEE